MTLIGVLTVILRYSTDVGFFGAQRSMPDEFMGDSGRSTPHSSLNDLVAWSIDGEHPHNQGAVESFQGNIH